MAHARWHDSMTRLDEGESALVSVPSSLPAACPPPRSSTPGIDLQNSGLHTAWSVRKTRKELHYVSNCYRPLQP